MMIEKIYHKCVMSLGPWAKSPLQALTSGVWKTEDCMRFMLSLNTIASATAQKWYLSTSVSAYGVF